MHSSRLAVVAALLAAAACALFSPNALGAEAEPPATETETETETAAPGVEPGSPPIPVQPAPDAPAVPAPPAAPEQAQPPAAKLPPPPAAPDRTEVPFVPKFEARHAFIQEQLDDGQLYAKVWWYGWMAGYTALALGQAIPAGLLTSRQDRVNFTVGAITSALAIVATGVMPLDAMYAGDRVRGLPADGLRLSRAEQILFATAKEERFWQSWIFHVLGAGVGVAAGLVVWLGYGYLVDGIVTALGSVALNEIQMWTQPTRAIDDAALYRTRFGVKDGGDQGGVRLFPVFTGRGFGVAGTF
ncbi:MAG TPA: hypothetical protein VGK67_24765 [Myxococcales bacterium]